MTKVSQSRKALLTAVVSYGDACCRGNEYDNRSEEDRLYKRVQDLLVAHEQEIRKQELAKLNTLASKGKVSDDS
jgi:hypothetical protein